MRISWLHGLAESIPGLLKRLQIRAQLSKDCVLVGETFRGFGANFISVVGAKPIKLKHSLGSGIFSTNSNQIHSPLLRDKVDNPMPYSTF